jgi:hypothetical protein
MKSKRYGSKMKNDLEMVEMNGERGGRRGHESDSDGGRRGDGCKEETGRKMIWWRELRAIWGVEVCGEWKM